MAVFIVAPRGLPKYAWDQGPETDLRERYASALSRGVGILYEVKPVAL